MTLLDGFWWGFGAVAGLIFFTRFYVQWLASERAKRSIVPLVFWYQSSIGSVMLLLFAVHAQSPIGALGQSLNIVIYARNLVHIWREHGTLSRRRYWATHGGVAVVATLAVAVVLWIWFREYQLTKDKTTAEVAQVAVWLFVGLVGQALFAGRFIIQWIATERRRKSVVPTIFWYLSIAASILMLATFTQRAMTSTPGEWVYAIGMVLNILIYGRNLWFIQRHSDEAADTLQSG
jgi:lipid-A-disaccharide synthase-like uncharacterized protein